MDEECFQPARRQLRGSSGVGALRVPGQGRQARCCRITGGWISVGLVGEDIEAVEEPRGSGPEKSVSSPTGDSQGLIFLPMD